LPVPTIIAVGVARPKAQGQAITRTDINIVIEKSMDFVDTNHIIEEIKAIVITVGTK
jgi:hypothetical protein